MHTAPAEELRRDQHIAPDHDAGLPVAVLEWVQNDPCAKGAVNSSRGGPTLRCCYAYSRTNLGRPDAVGRTFSLVVEAIVAARHHGRRAMACLPQV